MATATIQYGSKTPITIGVESTATSSDFTAGRESTEVDNSSNLFVDALVEGYISVGTTPTADTFIAVKAWGSDTSLASTAKDVLDGTDSVETLTSEGVGAGFLKVIKTLHVDATTSDVKYYFGPVALTDLFGEMPKYWGLFVSHNTGVNLNSTAGNHVINYTGIKYVSA